MINTAWSELHCSKKDDQRERSSFPYNNYQKYLNFILIILVSHGTGCAIFITFKMTRR